MMVMALNLCTVFIPFSALGEGSKSAFHNLGANPHSLSELTKNVYRISTVNGNELV